MNTHLARGVFLSLVLSLFATTLRAAEPAKALEPIQTVTTDAHGFFQVNGKPFFPILLYDAPMDETIVQQVGEKGFNVLTVKSGAEAASLVPKGFYGAVHASKKVDDGAGVLLVLSLDSPVLELKSNVIEKTLDYNKKASANLPGRPVMNAIGYWLGEPEGVKANTLPGKDKYEDLVAAIDVSAPYLYPVPYQPVSTVGDAVKRARDATGGKKSLLPILQLFSWEPTARFPTVAELRCMVYLSLIDGATGIGYYSYSSVKSAKNPLPKEVWDAVGPLNKDVADAGMFFAAGKPDDTVKPSGAASPVKWRAARRSNEGILLLANPTEQKQTVALTLAGATLHMGDKAAMKGDTLNIEIEPLGTETIHYTVK